MSEIMPVIPPHEYPERWSKVQALMAALGLDILLAYADDRATFGPAHARWLADFPVHFEPACVFIPAHGQPVLFCGPESEQYAMLTGKIPEVFVLREFTHPNEDYPYATIRSLREAIDARLPGQVRRAGIAGRGLIDAGFWSSLQEALRGVEWVDVENDVCALRAQKTPAELSVIRKAYAIASIGLQAGLTAITPGATERAIAAEIESAMRRAGAEGTGIDTIVASGPNTRPILARSTFRRIEKDDLVLLTVAPRYEGYHAAIGRPVLVGNPGKDITTALDVAWQAQQACFAGLRPGVEGRHVEGLGRRVVEEAGLGQYFLYSALHSVGVIEFEPPIFGPTSAEMLKPGMVISVDIPLFNAPWGGLRVEDGYWLTETGAQKLNETESHLKV